MQGLECKNGAIPRGSSHNQCSGPKNGSSRNHHSFAKRLFTYGLKSIAAKPACLIIKVKDSVENGHAKLNHVQKTFSP